ncbi:hypothetical protein TL16_g10738 [Triparma laevis f. inornata]|uniref:Uncharacterized protein n=1 Tax=Triparma laevis f. inornata TaxID=1714386 RepID=A0A9W7EPT2_9STRA|nr:hypothetical protein TL16_g10738 [Triparma laevis f. inornata]
MSRPPTPSLSPLPSTMGKINSILPASVPYPTKMLKKASPRKPDSTAEAEADTFGGFLEGEAEGMAEKLFKGGGGEAMDMFDEDSVAMKSLLDGGGKPLEMLQVALGFLQSFSLVALLEMEWPEWFQGLTLFTLDFSFTEDAGLGKNTRADVYNLGIVGMIFLYSVGQLLHWGYLRRLLKTCETNNENFKLKRCWGEFTAFLFLFLIVYLSGVNATLQMTTMEIGGNSTSELECARFKFDGCGSPKSDVVFIESFSPTACNGASIYRSSLSYADISKSKAKVRELYSLSSSPRTWYMAEREVALDDEGEAEERTMEVCNSDVATALSNLGYGCANCNQMQSTSSWTCNNLGLGSNEITYTQLDDGPCFHWKAELPMRFCDEACINNANKIGWILFVFYTVVPLFRLWKIGKAVKVVLNELPGEYEESFDVLAISARTASTHSEFSGVDDVQGDRTLPWPKKWWGDENINEDLGIQLAVSSALLAAFEEKWWWWKLFLMTERGVLATCVFTEVSVWAAFVVTIIGVAGSFYTRPYWEDEEDTADLIARCTTLLSVFLACLAESGVVKGDEIAVAVILNVSSIGTLVMLVMALGPRRMLYSVITFYNVKRRELKLSLDKNAAQKMSEKDALAMTEKEYLNKSKKIRGDLMRAYQDHKELAKRWLDWVNKEDGNEVGLDEKEKSWLEEAAKEFGKSMAWLYSSGDGTVFGCEVEDKKVVSLQWQGQGLVARKIPAAMFKLKHAKDINLTSNDVYISDATTAKVTGKGIFHVGNRQEKEVLEAATKQMGQTLEWLHNDMGEHNVGQWRGVKMDAQGVRVEGLGWAGQGLCNSVSPELSKLKGLKSLDLRFNACKFGKNKAINNMIDYSHSQAGGDMVRIASTDLSINYNMPDKYVKGKTKEYADTDYATLDDKQWRYRLIRLNFMGVEAFMFEDMNKEGLVLVLHKGMLCRVSKDDLSEYGGVEVAAWAIRAGLDSSVKVEGAETVCSIESVYEAGLFMCHGVGLKDLDAHESEFMMRVKKPGREPLPGAVTGTMVENKGEIMDSWKARCTFKLLPDVVEEKKGKGVVTKYEMMHGWEGGLVDHKLNGLLKQLGGGEEDTGLLFDSSLEKVALCDCARSLGKTVPWLLNGAGGYDVGGWRGITVYDGGRVAEIEWVDEELSGKLSIAFCSFEKLVRLDLSGNEGIEEEIPAELGALRGSLGLSKCVLFTESDHRGWAEKRLERVFKPRSVEEVRDLGIMLAMDYIGLVVLSAIVVGTTNIVAVNIVWCVSVAGGFLWAWKEKWLCVFVPPPPPPKPAHAAFKRTATQKAKRKAKK